jgi:putative membrane-bound dehydrogenase-like protein
LVFLVLLLLAPASFGKPLSPKEALATFQLESEDLRVSLVASEPEVVDPVALCFDAKGRLYVVESRGYPHPGKGLPKTKQGVVSRLEDTDGDGRFEKRTTFCNDLVFPNGILPWRKGFFVTDAPDVLYLEDTDDDGVADKREVILTGFFTNSSSEQLRVASPTLGPDGWVYLTSGLAGGKVTSPKHPERSPVEARKNDWRFHPETFEVESLTGSGQVGQAFDREGRRFVCDNRHPLRWVVFDSGILERNPNLSGASSVMDLAEPGAATPLYPLAPDTTASSFIPKLMQNLHAGSFTSACGLCFFTGKALPKHRGNFFVCEPAQNLVHCRSVVETRENFTSRPSAEGREFLASPDQWFRPVFAANGPDGALYLCDMYRKYVDHPNYLPPEAVARLDFAAGKKRGRIWKVTSRNRSVPAPWKESKGVGLAIREALKAQDDLPRLAGLADKSGANPWLRAAVFSSCPGQAKDLLVETSARVSPIFLEQAAKLLVKEVPADQLSAVVGTLLEEKKDWDFSQRIAFLLGFTEKVRKPFFDQLQPKARKASTNSNLPLAERLLAIRCLSHENRSQLMGLIDPTQPSEVRHAAMSSLAQTDDLGHGEKLLVMHPALGPEDRNQLLAALLSRKAFHSLILEALESARLPLHAVSLNQRRRFTNNPATKERASKLFDAGEKSDRMKVYQNFKEVLDLAADASAGQPIFQRACASCHRLGSVGYTVGPDLTGLRNQPADALLLHLIVPNREVYPTYVLYLAETIDGQTHAGILVEESSLSVTLVLPLGKRETIPRNKLKSLQASPVSLMPDGLEQTMTRQELADLLAFLRN